MHSCFIQLPKSYLLFVFLLVSSLSFLPSFLYLSSLRFTGSVVGWIPLFCCYIRRRCLAGTMSSVSTRRAPKSQGGLARLVSKFENLGSSKTPQDIGSAGEIRHDPIPASKFSDAPPAQENARDRVVGSSKTLAPPSLTPTSATRGQLETPLRDSHSGTTAPPSSKIGKLISRRGLAVADMRRLFERGNDKNVTSNVARTTTYEPKRVASPTKTTECNDHKPLSLASSPMKGSSTINLAGTLANGQEERDIVPDLVEHPEYLPWPLTSPDRFSRPSREDKATIEDNKSTWQRNEPRFKIRGGVFLHNTPAPLQNMVVTDVGTWRPNPLDTSELVLHSEDGKLRNDDQHLVHSFERVKGDGPELLENLQSEPRGQGGLRLPTSRSFPSQQSKVSNLRRKFDSALPSSVSMPSL